MTTMYEKIMDLPLFKGVGKDHVSSFLEKTNVNFLNYESGELVVTKGDDVRMLKFVISGEVRINHRLDGFDIVVEEICGRGRVLGADRLYGMSKIYSCDVYAIGRVSIMEFSKEQYVRLLNMDSIYLLSFFNFLSRRAQRPVETLERYAAADISARMSLLVGIFTDPDSSDVVISGSACDVRRYCGVNEEEFSRWLEIACGEGLVEMADERIRIFSKKFPSVAGNAFD